MTVIDETRSAHAAPADVHDRVRQVYARVDAGDVEGLLDLFSDDVVYDRPGYPSLVGRDAFERFYRTARVIREGVHVPDSVVVDGDGRVAVQGRFTGVLKDGRAVDLRYADFFRAGADGRFDRRDTYFFSPMV